MIRVNAAAGELFLDGVIGGDWGDDDPITATALLKKIEPLAGSKLTVRINSVGGSADEGVAIYNLLRRHEGGVDTVNEALAASAASIIFLAGDNRLMTSGSKVMIHRAMTIEIGNAEAMRKKADVLQMYDESMADIYAEHMGIDRDTILDMMSKETWFSADEAVESGLATAKNPSKTKQRAAYAAWFRHPPKDIAESQEEDIKANGRMKLIKARMKMWELG
jgi:ATP-dependent protease ClpP protease subunit